MSDDNCIANGERQKPLPAKRIEYLTGIPDLSTVLSKEQFQRFKRNEQLIDLHMIPETIRSAILDKYKSEENKSKDKLEDYFKQHNLRTMLEHIGEF